MKSAVKGGHDRDKVQDSKDSRHLWIAGESKMNLLMFFYSHSKKKCGDVNKRANGRDGSSKMQADD